MMVFLLGKCPELSIKLTKYNESKLKVTTNLLFVQSVYIFLTEKLNV